MEFKEWLESKGCQAEVTQDDDGSGYICLEVTLPSEDGLNPGVRVDVTVSV